MSLTQNRVNGIFFSAMKTRKSRKSSNKFEVLLLECPDLPDDWHENNADAINAFADAFRKWKQKVHEKTGSK